MSADERTGATLRIPKGAGEWLLDAVPYPCLLVGAEGVVRSASRRVTALLGWEPDELAGAALSKVLPEGAHWAEGDDLRLACARGGAKVAVEVQSTPIELEGEGPMLLVALHDMTRIRAALEAAELLRASFVESPLESMTIDHEGKVIEYNRAAERTFGFSREEVVGRDLADFIIPPAYRAAHRSGLSRLVATREPRVLGKRLELAGLRADGVEIPVELTITRIEGLEPPVFTGYVRDISDRKRMQAQLVTQEKLASLGTLTAGIAHEIKNPLNFVNNFASLTVEFVAELAELFEASGAGLAPEVRSEIEHVLASIRENATKISHHGKRADSIVRAMLLHARSSSGDAPQPTDLNALAAEYVNLAYHGMRATDRDFTAKLDLDFDASLGPIQAVPQALSRVILNLVSNALYATKQRSDSGPEPGYVPTVALRTRDLGGHVTLSVRDNGAGIEKGHLQKIFEPFFTTKPPGEGTGLGLSLSYDIVVHVHGGEMTVASEPRSFTEFTIALPKKGRAEARGAT